MDGDPTQLHQVLLNLCLNSRDAMPAGGEIRIGVRATTLDDHYAALYPEATAGPYLVVEVEDTGEGMSPEVVDKIFEPFFTTKAVGSGTGLGLPTSQAIVRSHGGFLRVYSDLGRGTRFQIYLPARVDAADPLRAESQPEFPRGNGELILVVDDEASVRQITGQTLEAFGYRVLTAADGAEGVSIYAQRRDNIALVLTDMMMPVMDGPAMINVLTRMQPGIRIIGASGLNANSQVARAGAAGVRHFLPKPYTADTLLRTIKQTLQPGEETRH